MELRKTNWLRIPWLAMAAAAAIGFFVAHAGVSTMPGYKEQSRAAVSLDNAAPTQSRAPADAARQAAALPSAPAEDIPLAQGFDALSIRARNGDLAANERLLRGLVRCKNQTYIGYRPYDEVDPNLKRTNDELAALREQFDSARTFCEGLSAQAFATEAEWLERAAESGDGEAMFCYALEPPLSQMPALSPEWLEFRRRYIAHARDYAELAFAQGYVAAAGALAASYANMQPGIPMITYSVPPGPPDLARAYAFARLHADRLRDIRTLRKTLALDWEDRAELLASQVSADERARGDAFSRSHAMETAPASRGLCFNIGVMP